MPDNQICFRLSHDDLAFIKSQLLEDDAYRNFGDGYDNITEWCKDTILSKIAVLRIIEKECGEYND